MGHTEVTENREREGHDWWCLVGGWETPMGGGVLLWCTGRYEKLPACSCALFRRQTYIFAHLLQVDGVTNLAYWAGNVGWQMVPLPPPASLPRWASLSPVFAVVSALQGGASISCCNSGVPFITDTTVTA